MTLERFYCYLIAYIGCLVMALMPGAGYGEDEKTGSRQDVLLLLSSSASYYQETAKQLRTQLAQRQHSGQLRLTSQTLLKLKNQPEPPDTDLVIAIGSRAASYVANQQWPTPTLNILLPRATYLQIQQQRPANTAPATAIYIDQPLSRVVALATALPLSLQTIGAVSGGQSNDQSSQLETLLNDQGIDFIHRHLSPTQKPIQVLRPLFAKSNLFIAIPENGVFNRAIAKWILSLSFQQKIPVIGFSKAYTDSGALVSVFSTPEDIGKQAAEVVSGWQSNGQLPPEEGIYPRYFTIKTNPVVARAMDIDLARLNENLLLQAVSEAEGKQCTTVI